MDNQKEIEKKQAFENLLLFKEILDGLGITFVLDGGTLLGAYRDKDFCEDDQDDVDLTTIGNEGFILDIIEEAGARGFELYHSWQAEEKTTAQIAVVKDGLKIDLMFKKIKKIPGVDRIWWTVYGGPNKITYKSVPAEIFEGSETIDFKGTEFLIPQGTEDYLTLRYRDWKTPVHRREYSCFTTDKVIRENYEDI